jgi:putative ABC transport system permease protein
MNESRALMGRKSAEFLRQAIETLWNNRFRSLLTMLGLIIGVGSVIAILAVGDATNRSVQNLLSQYSQASSFVVAKQTQPDFQNAAIRYTDARAVAKAVPQVKGVIPIMVIPMTTTVRHHNKTVTVITSGAGVGFDASALEAGRRFTPLEVAAHRHVCILSYDARNTIFQPGAAVTGSSVRLNGSYYTVVGVQAKPLNAGLLQSDSGSETVTVPYTLIPEFGYSYVAGLSIASDPAHVTEDGNAAIAALKKIHGQRAQYQERDIKTLNDGIAKVFQVLTGVIGVIAGISLLVGGVGIMNIMLVSVTERTREIGIRRAVGARAGDVLRQFLAEAIALSVIGGLAGIAVGAAASGIIAQMLKWSTSISPASVALSFAVAAAVGVFFGYYPARQASRLDPIESLRYE